MDHYSIQIYLMPSGYMIILTTMHTPLMDPSSHIFFYIVDQTFQNRGDQTGVFSLLIDSVIMGYATLFP